MSLWLPLKITTAGVVLKHANQVMDSLFERFGPMIFKFGFTQDPIKRWSNRKYGYQWERDSWQCMCIFYTSTEPWSPAMLEAALIDRYEVASNVKRHTKLHVFPPWSHILPTPTNAKANLDAEMSEVEVTAFAMRTPRRGT